MFKRVAGYWNNGCNRPSTNVSFVLYDVRADFHCPHPDKEALRYRVKDARKFLEQAGITE